jgi:hypothetical protein
VIDKPVKVSKVKKAVAVVDRGATFVASNTLGRVARFVGKRLLGDFPEEAVTGSFHAETKLATTPPEAVTFVSLGEGDELLEEEITPQLKAESLVDEEDEALFRQIYEEDTSTKAQERASVSA